jgi:uroporphyrinogen decarboxylase
MVKEYTGKERIEAIFQRERADRIPVILGLTIHLAQSAGYNFNEARLEPEKAWQIFLHTEEILPTDMPRVPGSPYLPDVIQARQEGTIAPEGGRKRRFDDKSTVDSFSYRPPKENRAYATFLEMARRANSTLTDRAIFGDLGGPWSIAAELRGIEPIIFDTVDDPEFVHKAMKVSTQLALDRAVAMAETGVNVRIGDPSAGCSLISPKIYREFVKPYHEQLFNSLRQETHVHIGLHMCGYVDPIMEDLVSLPIDWLEIDAPSSLEKMVSTSQGKIVIRGQIPTEVFNEGTKETIYKEVKRCVDTAARKNPFMLGPGCSVPYTAPLENIKHFLDAAHKYGSYDYIDGKA